MRTAPHAPRKPSMTIAVSRRRLRGGGRLLVLSAAVLTAVGLLGRGTGLVMLTTTLGPTAYLLLAHPEHEQARVRNALLGHGAATAAGLGLLAAFGLWNHPSVTSEHRDAPAQILAQALAVGVTLLLLTLLDAHHPPAAATALLITSGIARPGPPLYGTLADLAALIALSALVSGRHRPLEQHPARAPSERNQSAMTLPPTWIETIGWLALAAAFTGALIILADIVVHPPVPAPAAAHRKRSLLRSR